MSGFERSDRVRSAFSGWMAFPWGHGPLDQVFCNRSNGSQSHQLRDALEQELGLQTIRWWPLALSDGTRELGNLAVFKPSGNTLYYDIAKLSRSRKHQMLNVGNCPPVGN